MANNNDNEYEAGAPKKADVLIRSTQHIALKQDEMSEQTRQVASRLEEAIDLFSKNSQDATYVVKQSGEIFERLQSENSALKQEMLYLAKQSENIYAGLAEKITELSEQAKNRDDAMNGFADKVNDVTELSRKSEESYAEMADKIAELSEMSKRSENAFSALAEKLEAISNKLDAVSDLAVRVEPAERTVVERVEPVRVDNSEMLDKLNYLTEQMRKNEGAHTTLADKLEILSMRVEQFGMESAKGNAAAYSRTAVTPVAIPAPAQNIDYDKLAQKVADLISTREVISPDYIAAKVAEQIVLPEIEASNVKLSVDTRELARQTAELINVNAPVREIPAQTVNARIDLNEDEIAEKIAQKLGAVHGELAPASAIDIDEEELAQRLAQKLGGVKIAGGAVANLNIDEEELADRIALKVGSLKSEDFEILVDDEGCTSISKEIADNLDYTAISNVVADKLREALDLAAVNAPDYEDMAERISEKITVAGINEDAIADKAAAVLSNYLPEFDTDEITDKITGAVIDVVSAMPQPAIDSEAICNSVSEKLIESQEDHDYDIVIDDDGIAKITELVTEEINKNADERFAKVEEKLQELTELLTAEEEVEEEDGYEEEAEEAYDESGDAEEEEEYAEEYSEEYYAKLTSLMAAEIEKGTASRFDKVEEDIAKLTELVNNTVTGEEYEETEELDDGVEADYTRLSEVVAAEIEKGVSSRLDSVEENIAKLTELVSSEDEAEYEEEYEDYPAETDYSKLSEVVAAEIEKGVSSRLDSMQEDITRIHEIVAAEDECADADADGVEADYTRLSEVVAAEIEKGVSSRLDRMEENVERITEIVTAEDGEYDEQDDAEYEAAAAEEEAEYYAKLSEVVAGEIEKGVSSRLDKVEENVASLTDYVKSAPNSEVVATAAQEDYSRLSEVVAYEIERGMGDRFNKVDDDIARVKELVNDTYGTNARFDKIEDDIAKISALVLGTSANNSRFDKIEDDIAKLSQQISEGKYNTTGSEKDRYEKFEDELAQIKEMLASGIIAANAARDEAVATQAAAEVIEVAEEEPAEEIIEEEEPIVTVSDVVEPQPEEEPAVEEEEEEFEEDEEEPDDDDDDMLIDVLDMDAFSDDELMPGDLSELEGGVDFANMMKFKRSFIARIIQSNDDYKQYYGEVKHALISYKKVNSNVAWGAERFNKGRETIARLKIRGKTLCLYLALDPANYKTSVYHHIDVSDNKSVAGTPMMVKVKSNLGVRKAIRLIDEMLAMRNGEKKEIPERDYAAMYPYETIEELIEEGLVKDVRKNK